MADDLVPSHNNSNLPDHIGRMQDLIGGVANIQNSIDEGGGVATGLPFIGITNDGVWCYGQDRVEVEEHSLWAIDIRTWKHGYIAWPPAAAKERKPLGERMVPANMALPRITDLPNVGAPYQLQFSFELLCMSGEDAGTMALYKNGSYGAKVVNQNLVTEVLRQAKLEPSRMCPVVELLVRNYYHNEWRKTIYNPILQNKRWITFEEFDGFEGKPSPPPPQLSPSPPASPAQAAAPPPQQAQPSTGRRRPAQQPEPEPQPPPPPPQAATPLPTGRRRPGARVQPTA